MKVINASYSILSPYIDHPDAATEIYKRIENAGRTCYKSKNSNDDKGAEKFVRMIVKSGHEAMLEHVGMTVKFIVDRGISHELVRHRIASFAQESTRYCNYSQDRFENEITVIEPVFFMDILKEKRIDCQNLSDTSFANIDPNSTITKFPITNSHEIAYYRWYDSCKNAEFNYFSMLKNGCTPQEARSVLPTSLKTEIIMTANMREWRHFLMLRAEGTTGAPHPQMLEVTVPLLNELRMKLPALFDDIIPIE